MLIQWYVAQWRQNDGYTPLQKCRSSNFNIKPYDTENQVFRESYNQQSIVWLLRHCLLRSQVNNSSYNIGSVHYSDVIVSATASQITSVSIVCSLVCSGADQRKHQSPASLAFVRGIHRWLLVSGQKGPVTRKVFLFDDVIMRIKRTSTRQQLKNLGHLCWGMIESSNVFSCFLILIIPHGKR